MTDELERRLEALTDRAPVGTPDIGAVLTGGRRLRRRRIVSTMLAVITLISVASFAARRIDFTHTPDAIQPATNEDGTFVPATPGEPTYTLKDFRIEYPWAEVDGLSPFNRDPEERDRYCSMPANEDSCTSEGNAGFFYEWEWSTTRFPGEVACRVELYSNDGDLVGQTDWVMSGLEATSRRAGRVLVHVSAEPVRAEAACEAGTIESGPTHRFTFIRATSSPGRNTLYFSVETLTKHSTGMCRLKVRYESGYSSSSTFTMTGEPRSGRMELGAPYRQGDPLEDAEVRCRQYTREVRR